MKSFKVVLTILSLVFLLSCDGTKNECSVDPVIIKTVDIKNESGTEINDNEISDVVTEKNNQVVVDPVEESEYNPYSLIGIIYDTVLDALTLKYFEKYPDLNKEHTEAMRAFIIENIPKKNFIEQLVDNKRKEEFDRAIIDTEFRESRDFKDGFSCIASTASVIAEWLIMTQRQLYVAVYVEKNALQVELIKYAESLYDLQIISWVINEVAVEEFVKALGDNKKILDGDRFFFFMSPAETWEILCGRQGYIQVRGNKIIDVIITLMN